MKEEVRIAMISNIIVDACPNDASNLDCAKLIVKSAVNAGIPQDEIRKALDELYGKE